MNLPATYRHDYDYEPPRPARVYDTPRIVEHRPVLGALRAMVRQLVVPAGRKSVRNAVAAASSRRIAGCCAAADERR